MNRNANLKSSSAPKSVAASTRSPVAPLPNPGEGGPIYPDATAVPPLPDVGEGGPVTPTYPDAVAPLPNPGEGGPIYPDNGGTPVIPLPNPGEAGPVYPGGSGSIVVFPLPNPPCFFCSSGSFCKVRFLNSTNGYLPFRILVNNRLITSGLDFAALTPYGKVSNGFQTITVTAPNGYIYLRKTLPFRAGESVTIAVVNSATGIDLLEISDAPCSHPANTACFRCCNLGYYSNPLDLFLYDGRLVFSDMRFKEVTSFKTIRPGEYFFYLANTVFPDQPAIVDIETVDSQENISSSTLSQPLISFPLKVIPHRMITAYILNWQNSSDALQVLIVEDATS